MSKRIIAVDPGEKRLGIAISDPTCSLASPLTVIKHINMLEDCTKIISLAHQNGAEVIVIGEALGGDGEMTRQARHARKIADTISGMSPLVVILWDESDSTRIARENAFLIGVKRKNAFRAFG